MSGVLVDSNIILDLLTQDPNWYSWSAEALEESGEASTLVINPIIYTEIAPSFTRIEDLDAAMSVFRRDPLPWDAAFLAGQCFAKYRRLGGQKRSPLPDFYIGAHAAVAGMSLLTRDASRYRTYFPGLALIAP